MKQNSDRLNTTSFVRNALITVTTLGVLSAGAWAAPQVTYVGLGRYSCSGSEAECAQINFNNQQVEESNRRRYLEDQERAQRHVDENRRQERERQDRCSSSGRC